MEYDSRTLTGNWFEERAPTLHGVMTDTGCRLYKTTFDEAFPQRPPATQRPSTRAGLLEQRAVAGKSARSPFSMVQRSNAAEAEALARLEAPSTGFGTPHTPSEPPGRFDTTYCLSYGPKDPVANVRAIAQSGMCGEVFKEDPDPQHDTRCQRVWLPTNTLIKPASQIRAEFTASGRPIDWHYE